MNPVYENNILESKQFNSSQSIPLPTDRYSEYTSFFSRSNSFSTDKDNHNENNNLYDENRKYKNY